MMPKTESKICDCDVLVIGGGLAGTAAAIRATDFTDNVTLVDKAKVSKSGCSTFAAGVMLAPQSGDDFDVWAKEIVEGGVYINDQDWLKVTLEEGPELIDWLKAQGVEFEKDEKGNLMRVVGRAHINTRVLMFHGPQFMQTMRKAAMRRKINLVERVMITNLLTSDGQYPTRGRVIGAIGFHVRSGQLHVFRAKSVILATCGIRASFLRNLMGDGLIMGFQAGAELWGMEWYMPFSGWTFERKYLLPAGMNMWQGYGMYLVNAKGERFMGKYDPVLKERVHVAELHMAICKELVEGRGPVYMDMRHFSPETWDRFRRVIPRFMRVADTVLEPWKHKVQYEQGIGSMRSLSSGFKHNIFCETNLPGLYVAGEVSGYPGQGHEGTGGMNLLTCLVGGHRAGEHASQYSKLCGEVEIHQTQLDKVKESIYQPLSVKNGITPREMMLKIQEVAAVPYALFRSERGINKVLTDLAKLKTLLPEVSACDYHTLVRANEIKSYLLCLLLIYRAALERKETRATHARSDYPYRDDINWLKHVILQSEGDDRVGIRLEPIPIYRYPVKPEKLGRVPPKVPPAKIEIE